MPPLSQNSARVETQVEGGRAAHLAMCVRFTTQRGSEPHAFGPGWSSMGKGGVVDPQTPCDPGHTAAAEEGGRDVKGPLRQCTRGHVVQQQWPAPTCRGEACAGARGGEPGVDLFGAHGRLGVLF